MINRKMQGWLVTWKEIAAYIGSSVNTSRKFYMTYGMPVRYGPGKKVFALPEELDRWGIELDEAIQSKDLHLNRQSGLYTPGLTARGHILIFGLPLHDEPD